MAWVIVFFDLPQKTYEEQKRASAFRKALKRDGYLMVQYSVYVRACPSQSRVETHKRRLKKILPEEGEVRVLPVTNLQWERMIVYQSCKEEDPEDFPEQSNLFI